MNIPSKLESILNGESEYHVLLDTHFSYEWEVVEYFSNMIWLYFFEPFMLWSYMQPRGVAIWSNFSGTHMPGINGVTGVFSFLILVVVCVYIPTRLIANGTASYFTALGQVAPSASGDYGPGVLRYEMHGRPGLLSGFVIIYVVCMALSSPALPPSTALWSAARTAGYFVGDVSQSSNIHAERTYLEDLIKGGSYNYWSMPLGFGSSRMVTHWRGISMRDIRECGEPSHGMGKTKRDVWYCRTLNYGGLVLL